MQNGCFGNETRKAVLASTFFIFSGEFKFHKDKQTYLLNTEGVGREREREGVGEKLMALG